MLTERRETKKEKRGKKKSHSHGVTRGSLSTCTYTRCVSLQLLVSISAGTEHTYCTGRQLPPKTLQNKITIKNYFDKLEKQSQGRGRIERWKAGGMPSNGRKHKKILSKSRKSPTQIESEAEAARQQTRISGYAKS